MKIGKNSLSGRFFKTLLILFLFLILLSCASTKTRLGGDPSSPGWTKNGDSPKVVAVLPFTNNTAEEGIEMLVRESFYSHLSALNYYDLELSRVDSTLKIIEQKASQPWRNRTSAELGEILRADLIFYGKVKAFKKYFLGIYSQIAIEVEIEMVECKSGEGRWTKTIIKRSHEGGLPFDLFGIAPAAVRSSIHMMRERTVDLVERLTRELIGQIPNPPPPPVSPTVIEIQVASFLDRSKAEKSLKKIQAQGLNPLIKEVKLGDNLWRRIILGPFYNRDEAEMIKERVRQSTKFKPIIIQRYPGREAEGSRKEEPIASPQ